MMNHDNYSGYSARKNKGVYIALGCCLLSVGLAGWGIFGSRKKAEIPTVPQTVITAAPERPVNVPNTDVPNTRNATEKPTSPATEKAEFLLPCGTQIIKDYSRGELVESKTMGDFRVHNGIDFKANKGDDVKAVANGKVLSVTESSLWGWVVEIDHGNNMVAKYCGLMKNPAVKKGDTVSAGKIIGRVGTIPTESADDIHLHFEVRISGEVSDPLAALGRAE